MNTITITHHRPATRARRVAVIAVASVAAMVLASVVTFQTSRAAFSATTSNGTNNFAAGSVALSDDDSGSVMFNMTGMKPGDTATKCINVSYTGSLLSDIKLYGTVGGTGLAPFLNTTIEVGINATGGLTGGCLGFVPTSTLHNGTLAAFGSAHTNFANGLAGFAAAVNPASKSYRITVSLQDNAGAQGKTATANFTWEAQNV